MNRLSHFREEGAFIPLYSLSLLLYQNDPVASAIVFIFLAFCHFLSICFQHNTKTKKNTYRLNIGFQGNHKGANKDLQNIVPIYSHFMSRILQKKTALLGLLPLKPSVTETPVEIPSSSDQK